MATNVSGTPAKKTKKMQLVNKQTAGEDTEIQNILQALDSCQNDIDKLSEKASEEILEIERKFMKLKKPHFVKRNDIIKTLRNFWVTTFVNHPQLSPLIGDDEVDCLQYLIKIEVEDFDVIKFGFKIKFYFDKCNPYFENEILTKEFTMGTNGEHISISTPVRWRKDQNLCQMKNKDLTASNSLKRGFEEQKFFDWFTDNSDPQGDDVADIVKDDIWVSPMQYYIASDIDGENGLDDENDSEDDNIGSENEVEGEEPNEGEEDE